MTPHRIASGYSSQRAGALPAAATAADNKSDWLRGTAADPRKKAAKQT
jgi:hypothetical protein